MTDLGYTEHEGFAPPPTIDFTYYRPKGVPFSKYYETIGQPLYYSDYPIGYIRNVFEDPIDETMIRIECELFACIDTHSLFSYDAPMRFSIGYGEMSQMKGEASGNKL